MEGFAAGLRPEAQTTPCDSVHQLYEAEAKAINDEFTT